jgi:hypothetical protein
MEFFDLTNDNDFRDLTTAELTGRPVRSLDGNDTVNGTEADDDINGNQGNDIIDGRGASDRFIRGGKGNDSVSGGAGNDPHVNGNNDSDTVDGGEGDDTVFGGRESDLVMGGNGNDLIHGDFGIDTLMGGAGADTFVLQRGKGEDVILDFTVNVDTFFLEELNPSNISLSESGGNTIIADTVTGQPVATIVGVNQATIAGVLGVPAGTIPIEGQDPDAAGGSFNETSLEPSNGWTGNVFIDNDGGGWLADGNVDIITNSFTVIGGQLVPVDNALVFRIIPDNNDQNDNVSLRILDSSSGIGFSQNTYNAQEDQGFAIIGLNLTNNSILEATLFINE